MVKILSKAQIRELMQTDYLSAKGRKVAREVLAGKHNKTRKKEREKEVKWQNK